MDDSGTFRIPFLHQYLRYYGGVINEKDIIPCPEDSQMRCDWGSLPLLALKQILKYLNSRDALSAMSTCRHWRSGMLMYEDKKASLKLRVNDIERSLFMSRIFRRQSKRLLVIVNTCNEEQIAKFCNVVMSMFYDVKLQEMVFVGNSYMDQNPHAPIPEVPRATVESMVPHMRSLKRLALLGCKLSTAKNMKLEIKDKDSIRGTERVRIREFVSDPLPCDSVLSRCNTDLMKYSSLQTMILDYELINTESLETLSKLMMFKYLTMVIRDKPHFALEPIDWLHLQTVYANPLNVTVCLLQLPHEKIEEIMDNVFVQGLRLVSFKAIFCKTMHMQAIVQMANMYNKTLQEFVWADAPAAPDAGQRHLKNVRLPELNMCNVNPLILMCWQCERLRRLVVHGYWIWQYDVLGMVRLRRGLRHLEVSSVFSPQGRIARVGEGISRVLRTDPAQRCDVDFLEQICSFSEMAGWTPVPWERLHPGLRSNGTRAERADYLLMETRMPFGVTYPYPFWRNRYYEYLVPATTQKLMH